MGRRRHGLAPIMPFEQPRDRAFMVHLCFKSELDFACGGNFPLLYTAEKRNLRFLFCKVQQADLFDEYSLEREYIKSRLMKVLDLLNEWWGSNTLFIGALGIERA